MLSLPSPVCLDLHNGEEGADVLCMPLSVDAFKLLCAIQLYGVGFALEESADRSFSSCPTLLYMFSLFSFTFQYNREVILFEREGVFATVGKASDFGSEGLGFDFRHIRCDFYPSER